MFIFMIILIVIITNYEINLISQLEILEVVRLRRMLKPHELDLMREETGVPRGNPQSQVEIN